MEKQSVAHKSGNVDIMLGQLKKLKRNERVLLGLYFYEQLSIEEIAFILKKSVSEVQSQLEQILPRLILNTKKDAQLEPFLFEISG